MMFQPFNPGAAGGAARDAANFGRPGRVPGQGGDGPDDTWGMIAFVLVFIFFKLFVFDGWWVSIGSTFAVFIALGLLWDTIKRLRGK